MTLAIKTEVANLIQERRRREIRPWIFLPKEKWERLYKAIEPQVKKTWGAMLTDPTATEQGYDNFLFYGCPICLEEKACG